MTERVISFVFALYRALKHLWPAPARCRYWPSCSAYAEESLRRHGLSAGARLVFARLRRCHPWGGGGFDPVPEKVLS